jgi:hypothetical protein
MTRLLLIPLLAATLALSSCALKGNSTASKTPPIPAPDAQSAAAKPSAPPPPVSTPQTQVQLPPPQTVNPAALATIPPVREELPSPEPATVTKTPPTRKSSSTPAQTTGSPRTEQPAQTVETPAPVQGPPTPPATTPAEEAPRLQPVYSEEERRRVWGELEKRKGDIEGVLRGLNQSRMSADQKNVVERVRSFISMAEDYARRGDFRSAEALSGRAVILARELASGR